MKSNFIIVSTLVVLTIIIIPLGYSAFDGESEDNPVNTDDQAKQAIENEGSFKATEPVTYKDHEFPAGTTYDPSTGFDVPEGEHVTDPDGNMYTGSGILMENGQLKNAEKIGLETSEGSAEGRNAQNMDLNPPGYTIGSADFWQTPSHTVINGQDIQKQGEEFSVGEGQSVNKEHGNAFGVDEYSSSGEGFSVGNAKKVIVDNKGFSDIKNSNFETDNGELVKADVTSAKDNNTYIFRCSFGSGFPHSVRQAHGF